MSLPFKSTTSDDSLPSHYGWPKSSSLKSTYRNPSVYDDDNSKGYKNTRLARFSRFLQRYRLALLLTGILYLLYLYNSFHSTKTEDDASIPVVDAPIDLSMFDDSESLPLKDASQFNHNYPPFMSVHKLSESQRRRVWGSRAKAVQRAFSHGWDAYVEKAWGSDILNPVSGKGEITIGLGLTIVDSLDTAWIMNKTIFDKGFGWIKKEDGLFRNSIQAREVNVMDTTANVLGGLLGAYHVSKELSLLKAAVKVADRLLPAFDHGIPVATIDLNSGKRDEKRDNHLSTAAALSLQLEFKYLTHITNDPKYWNAVQKATELLFRHPKDKTARFNHLVPSHMDATKIELKNANFGHLAKQYLLSKEGEPFFLDQYRLSFHKGIKKHLLMRSSPSNFLFIREIVGPFEKGSKRDRMDSSVCKLSATLAQLATRGRRVPLKTNGRKRLLTGQDMEELYIAEELAGTCYEMYHQTLTGLAPNAVTWNSPRDGEAVRASKGVERTLAKFKNLHKSLGHNPMHMITSVPVALESVKHVEDGKVNSDFVVERGDSFSALTPEAVEAFFVLYRVTGDDKYREWGWRVFRSIEQWAKVSNGGYVGVIDVNQVPTEKIDKMNNALLGQTLKYLYLMFSDSTLLPLEQTVFNSASHPLPTFPIRDNLKKKLIWLH
ncbi:seven-hairpin glycosidase [Rhizoclosmatium globosum]|uniref:alpha-1,2-Mannosidase n=1 Tax=Rhizoclosmatium globosum TaxID=329046 RepID=A0A1Y2CHW0_9FUNG|nr:seven-hairpin glycosidase [Rhizoclosmatium globosum]|eukprot:ORY46497.1 seven-hairpin glycosidase [Rhizoclosmatium globosum]